MSINSTFPDMLSASDNKLLNLMSYPVGSKIEGSVQRMYDIIDTAWPIIIKDIIFFPLIEQDINKLQLLLNSYPQTTTIKFDDTASNFFIDNYASLVKIDAKLQVMNNQYFIYYTELRNQIAAGILSLQNYTDSIYAYIFNYYSNIYNSAPKVNGNPSPDYVGTNNNIPSDTLTIAAKINASPYGGFDYSTINTIISNLSSEYALIQAYVELSDPLNDHSESIQNMINSINVPASNISLYFYNDIYGTYNLHDPSKDFEISGSLSKYQTLITKYNTDIQSKIMVTPGTRTVDFSGVNVADLTFIVNSIMNLYNNIMRKVSYLYDIKQYEYSKGVTQILVKKTFREKIANALKSAGRY
jgi:hypothetical protein